jgi:hypothetical protein
MDKVLVEIFLPAANMSFDVYLPIKRRMSEVMPLINKVISDLSEGKYQATDDAVLYERKSGVVCDVNSTIEKLGIKNGSQLMLI